ncbi:MAG TPA: PAS domain-containing protein [Rhizomicrobium sp.]|jgi:hypothetical protein|nr:PAS domain-containing protein [Rhizomicrobium sp.]
MVEAKNGARTRGMAFDWELQATQPAIIRARDYWQSRRGDRAMPNRADLNPIAMRSFTEHVGLVEIRRDTGAEVDYFIRRAGTIWEAVFGPMTSRLIQESCRPRSRRAGGRFSMRFARRKHRYG